MKKLLNLKKAELLSKTYLHLFEGFFSLCEYLWLWSVFIIKCLYTSVPLPQLLNIATTVTNWQWDCDWDFWKSFASFKNFAWILIGWIFLYHKLIALMLIINFHPIDEFPYMWWKSNPSGKNFIILIKSILLIALLNIFYHNDKFWL